MTALHAFFLFLFLSLILSTLGLLAYWYKRGWDDLAEEYQKLCKEHDETG